MVAMRRKHVVGDTTHVASNLRQHLLNRGLRLEVVSQLLGHANVSVAQLAYALLPARVDDVAVVRVAIQCLDDREVARKLLDGIRSSGEKSQSQSSSASISAARGERRRSL